MNSKVPLEGLIVWIEDARKATLLDGEPSQWLTLHEMDRWHSFKFEAHRDFYVAAHLGVRVSVAAYLEIALSDISISRKPCPRCASTLHGPPTLVVKREALPFSLSKSDPYFAFAIARCDIGIDVERSDRKDAMWLGSEVFCPAEQEEIERYGDATALRYWVRKEAVAKARGIGLVDPPCMLDVSGSRFTHADDEVVAFDSDGRGWLVRDIVPERDDICLSIAVPIGQGMLPINVIETS